MTRTIEERMRDGDADPGMYPEVAERVFGWREQEDEQERERAQYDAQLEDALSSADHDGKEDAPMTNETKGRDHGDEKPSESGTDDKTRTQVDETETKSTTTEKPTKDD